jgi:hypothetical protein
MSTKTHAETTSAANKSIGFEFQFYYFLYRLLMLSEGESVGLEVEDDVSAKLNNNRLVLVQLKHTIQESVSGDAKAMSTLDGDLWKTISNWSKTIGDPNAGRALKGDQLKFSEKCDFVLVTNKIDNNKNRFLNAVDKYKRSEISAGELRNEVTLIQASTKNSEIEKYIQDLLDLDIDVSNIFMLNLAFEFDVSDIILQCKKVIKGKMVDDSRLDEIFMKLDSQVRQDNYETVRDKKQIEINFQEFHTKYRRYFEMARSSELKISELGAGTLFKENPLEETFIKQLVDVGDLDATDTSAVLEHVRMLAKLRFNLDLWVRLGDVTDEEVDALHTNAKSRWKVEFKHCHKDTSSHGAIVENCSELLYNLRKTEIKWVRGQLDLEISHGELYHLSNVPEIGWHPEWEKKYK